MLGGIDRDRGSERQHDQKACGLDPALQITAHLQILQEKGWYRRAVPPDRFVPAKFGPIGGAQWGGRRGFHWHECNRIIECIAPLTRARRNTKSNMAHRIVIDLREWGIAEVPVLGRYDYQRAQRGIDLHAHRAALEICYLAKGRQMYRVRENDYALRGGDVFVTLPGEVHSTGESPQEKGKLYWVQFVLPRGSGGFLNADAAAAAELIAALRRLPHRHFSGAPALGRLLDEIIVACRAPLSPLQRLAVQNRLTDFLLRVLALSQLPPRSSVTRPFSELLRYIDANLHQKLPLELLSARLNLSLPRFKARFKEEVGIPPAEYVVRCRIAAARRRLQQPGTTITRVAMDLGFPSSQYFATVFKRFTGQQPRSGLTPAVRNGSR